MFPPYAFDLKAECCPFSETRSWVGVALRCLAAAKIDPRRLISSPLPYPGPPPPNLSLFPEDVSPSSASCLFAESASRGPGYFAVATDGSVKTLGSEQVELGGWVSVQSGHCRRGVSLFGFGSSSYNAECGSLYHALLSLSNSSPIYEIQCWTDSLSLISRLASWTFFNHHDGRLASLVSSLCSKTKLSIHFSRGHSGILHIEAADSLINDVWESLDKSPSSLPPLAPSVLEHSAVMSLWNIFEKANEKNLFPFLHSRLQSESAALWRSFDLDRSLVKKWLALCPADRFSQVLLLRLVTNSIPKSKGIKLICPWCEVEASTAHILVDCPRLCDGREEAFAFSCSTETPYNLPPFDLKTYGNNPKLLPNCCKFNKAPLLDLLRRSSGFLPPHNAETPAPGAG